MRTRFESARAALTSLRARLAEGPAIALALEHSGLAWKGAFPGTGATPEWGELKPTTPWGHVPTLEVPGVGTMGPSTRETRAPLFAARTL